MSEWIISALIVLGVIFVSLGFVGLIILIAKGMSDDKTWAWISFFIVIGIPILFLLYCITYAVHIMLFS